MNRMYMQLICIVLKIRNKIESKYPLIVFLSKVELMSYFLIYQKMVIFWTHADISCYKLYIQTVAKHQALDIKTHYFCTNSEYQISYFGFQYIFELLLF